jgi:hypothetical protein
MAQVRLPPGIGKLLTEPLIYSAYLQRFMAARRMRFCLNCKTMGSMDEMGVFTCQKCQKDHNGRWGNLTAPRAFDKFQLLAGRGGGKTLIGAHAVREELMIPGAMWWVMSDTYKRLHDSTFPTLVGLMHPQWIRRWDPEHVEITLHNDAVVAFRSLEDPERARGPHGIAGMWFDEAALCPKRAWDVGTPMLIKAGGIALATTTPLGYDWTYDEIEKHALVYKTPGYWFAKWWTEHNPLFMSNPVMKQKIEQARRSMPSEMFAQEYQAERTNAQGLVYGALVHQNILRDDAAIKAYIPEWEGHIGSIDSSRPIIVGLDSGIDHPFGAVMIVVTERALVVVADYLERSKAQSLHHAPIWAQFCLSRFTNVSFAANKNEANLKLEWGLKDTGISGVENKHEIGIPRVYGWLALKQLKFAYIVPRTIEQMASYRYADNTIPSTGEKREKEKVFKLKDELPDGVRYGVMLHPALPDPQQAEMSEEQQRRWAAFDDKTRAELTRLREAKKAEEGHVVLGSRDYPLGEFYQHDGGLDNYDDISVMY